MNWSLNILAGLLIVIGVVWFSQGINVLLGSFMSGNSLYAFLGVLLVVVEIIVLVFTNRRRKAFKKEENSD